MPRSIYIVFPAGQLGNRLLQYSNFIAFALENNLELNNPGFSDYSEYFAFFESGKVPAAKGAYLIKKIKNRPSSRRLHKVLAFVSKQPVLKRFFYSSEQVFIRPGIIPSFIAVLASLGTVDKCNLDDWSEPLLNHVKGTRTIVFTGWKYRAIHTFDKYAPFFREIFAPKEIHLQNINKLLASNRKTRAKLIGVHIRHGDYKSHKGGRYFFTIKEYKRKMKEVSSLFYGEQLQFMICSNEKLDIGAFSEFDVFFGNNHVIEDMYAFAKCDYIIGPPSTYTGWASFYGNVPYHPITSKDMEFTREGFKVFDQKDFLYLDELFT